MADSSDKREERALLAELCSFSSSNLADVLLPQGLCSIVTGLTNVGARCTFAGPALTVLQGPRPVDAPVGVKLTKHIQVVDEVLRPGEVLVVAAGPQASTFGFMLSLRAQALGAAGVVVDGFVRDIDELPEAGLPVHARGGHPYGSGNFFETLAIGAPNQLADTTVTSSDIVFGDGTGVLVFPREHLASTVAACRSLIERERRWERNIRSGTSIAHSRHGGPGTHENADSWGV